MIAIANFGGLLVTFGISKGQASSKIDTLVVRENRIQLDKRESHRIKLGASMGREVFTIFVLFNLWILLIFRTVKILGNATSLWRKNFILTAVAAKNSFKNLPNPMLTL